MADGSATAEPGAPEDANLVLTLGDETFEKTFRGITAFPDAIQAGALQVSDMQGLARFGTLYPMRQ